MKVFELFPILVQGELEVTEMVEAKMIAAVNMGLELEIQVEVRRTLTLCIVGLLKFVSSTSSGGIFGS